MNRKKSNKYTGVYYQELTNGDKSYYITYKHNKKDILTGKEQGAKRDIVLLNAGAALYTIRKAETIKDGVKLAAEMIDSGKANEKLEQFIAYTNVK